CSSPQITENQWTWGIQSTDIDAFHSGIIAQFEMENTVSITTESSGFSRKYIDATLEDNILKIFTTSDFENYEDQETALQIQLRINFVCASPPNKFFVFYQGLKSANNHDPVFSESMYEISVKLPLPKSFDLTFFKEVMARDIDLEHNRVNFHTPSSNFIDVGTSPRIGEDKKTFYATLTLNQQLLTLSEPFSFTIIATDSGLEANRTSTAQIMIVPDEEATYTPQPRFQKAIYRGHISETGAFSYENILLEGDSYSEGLSFAISGVDGDLYSIQYVPPYTVEVSLKSPLSEENTAGKTFLTATISASHPETHTGSTVLLVDLPDVPIVTTPKPMFEKSLIRGSINLDMELSIEAVVLAESTYTTEITFSMNGDDSSKFELTNEENLISIELKDPLTAEEISSKDFYSFVIVATNPVSGVGETAVIISVPEKICEDLSDAPTVTTPKPTFEKSLIKGSINLDMELSIESVVLTESSYTSDTTFSVTGDDSSKFVLTNEQNLISIELKDPLTAEEINSKDFYSFIIVATNPVSGVGETAVIVSVPEKICEECPTTTVCPECPTTAPPTVDISPKFQNQFYSFTIKSNEFQKIGEVFATSANSDAVVGYSIASENAYLMTRLTIDPLTGELFLREELASGYYEADVYARITVDDETLQDTSSIKLTVTPVVTCPDGDVTVEKSLAIQYLKENEIHRNVFSSQLKECNYAIRSVLPDDKDYVHINSTTNTLETYSLDREDAIFKNYEVPQIQINLRLYCGETPILDSHSRRQQPLSPSVTQSSRGIDPSISDGRWYTLTNDIDFRPDMTVITIIIEDVNDNHPVFDPLTPSLIGYPEPGIANHIIPSQLVIIHATDIDAGTNAKIKYTLAENNYFQINPTSGVITPLSDGLSTVKSVEITVYATDNNGAENGLRTSHTLSVKRLDEKHLTVVTLRDNNLNTTADDVIAQLNAESQIKMIILHSAIVPYVPITSRQLRDAPLSALKMIVYAFGDNGEPLETHQVQRQLESFLGSRQLTYSSYEDEFDDDDLEEHIVWIIVVSVVSGLLLISLFVIFLMWWFKIRPYEYKTMVEDSTTVSQLNLQNDFDEIKTDSPPPMSFLETDKRESVSISGSTLKESTDEPSKRAVMLLNLLDGEPEENSVVEENEKRERKKSQGVTFNELVERIDIETDPF
ncbi:Protocadherin-15, partial [Pseudolycoriella hygida]